MRWSPSWSPTGAPTIGLLPGLDRDEADGWVDVAVATGLGELRNGLVVRLADALVAVGWSHGTLSEVALALRAGLPVVCLGAWRACRPSRSPPRVGTRRTGP